MTPVLLARTYWVPKAGNSEAEYEDAFYPERHSDPKGRVFRFAMADGSSEGMLSGPWAKILVRSFYRTPQRPGRASARLVVARACDSWETWKAAYLRRRSLAGKPVQWWEEEGLSVGPFATLLGVAFILREGSGTGRWDAVAMGDTCFFVVRGGRLTTSFPVADSSGFGSRPVLLSGKLARNAGSGSAMRDARGSFSTGDSLYLMTDALAAWFLKEAEAGGRPWEALDGLEGREEEFLRLVDCLRKSGKTRNDDVTVTCIRVV
jgi:hypothetical protein